MSITIGSRGIISSRRPITKRSGFLPRGTGTGARANDIYFLRVANPNATVIDDGSIDVLTGNSGRDWLFANLVGSVLDSITDKATYELVDELTPP
jgi:hypothetical protein